jgi:hypothetical protein
MEVVGSTAVGADGVAAAADCGMLGWAAQRRRAMVGRVGVFGLGIFLAGMVVAIIGCGDSSSSTVAWGAGTGSGTASGGTGTGGSSSGSTKPMLVIVDTNQTMTASPGQGVGVFVQYQSGGHWNVWWTCDTDKTSLDCHFQVIVSIGSGALTNLATQSTGSGVTVYQPYTQEAEAITTTSTGVDGITFDTPVGTQLPVITVEASVDGAQSGSFLFFVQDGKINGGYMGALTNPLQFQPSSP